MSTPPFGGAQSDAMDTDAYGSFINVDMDAIQPLFTIGIIGGTNYMDAEDSAGYRPRQGLEVFKRAVAFFKTRGVTQVAHLGNVIAAENAAAGTQWTALQSFEVERSKLHYTVSVHFAPGHSDLMCFSAGGVQAALKPSRGENAQGTRAYYAVFPCPNWRLVVRVAPPATAAGFSWHAREPRSCCASPPSDAQVMDAFDSPLPPSEAALEGTVGAGISDAQLVWLGAQLSVADAAGEKVIIMCHLSLAGLPNGEEVSSRLGSHPGVVAAFLSLHDGGGMYSLDTASGVHHLAPRAASGLEVNEDAFGVLQVFETKMSLEMKGLPPIDVGRVPVGGYPTELALPKGGRLVTAADGVPFMGFMFLMLFFVRMLATPFQPIMRMLTTSEPAAEGSRADDEPPPEADAPPNEDNV